MSSELAATGVEGFMATMVARSPAVPRERALALVREHYGVDGQLAPLTGERDENFRLTASDGTRYVLKIANCAEAPPAIELQVCALLHLEQCDPGLPCPRMVRTRAGDTQVSFEDEAGTARSARLLSYLSGRLLGSAARSAQQRRACGQIGARLSRALQLFRHPGAHRALIWDVRHVGHLQHLLQQMPSFPYRARAAALLELIVPDVERRLPGLRQQVVHNDLNPLNILVDPLDESRVVGVFDFGDLTWTALIADVAVAAAELIPPDCATAPAAHTCVREVAGAYHADLPLWPAECALLNRLVAARLLMNVVVHEWHVQHNPANRHYAALAPDFMATRLMIAAELLREEIRL
ncbi:MAG: phosphotransferase [Gammaproteobacteria bacterium]|nr:phosphotransferase [Gammaproteobacteria bacterium]MBV9620665.1 phosphotransferase [Gammaproteobacteria bacterium]